MTYASVKQQFFSLRNGIIAKVYHDAGAPYKHIYGLQLPQLMQIAGEIGKDNDLARQLWADKECRESRLLACRLFDKDTLNQEEALTMANDVLTTEEADYLSFALLRHLNYATSLLTRLDVEHPVFIALSRNLK